MTSSMAELERAAVQLWEAKRFADVGDVPHGRLALLLLDNAVEMSLLRSAKTKMAFATLYNNAAYQLKDIEPEDEQGVAFKREIESKTLPTKRRKQIERNFAALVDYVFEGDGAPLPEGFADCLKILHRYRNAAYHRDSVRADVLGPAVRIQFFLYCSLLGAERPVMSEIAPLPAAISDILGEEPATRGGFGDNSSSIRRRLADRVLSDLELDHAGIAAVLSDHLVARLAQLDQDLTTIAESNPLPITRWATLRLVQQAPTELEDFDAEPAPDFWTRDLPVDEALLEQWAVAAVDLRDETDAYEALRSFARVEQPLAALEEPTARFIEDIDRAEQRHLDEIRGR